MAKPVQKAEINSFIKGLISEASPLTFPPNAELDGENFEINKDGTRTRRLGINFESSYQLRSTGYYTRDISSLAITSFRWTGANGNPGSEFGVIQLGTHVDIYDLSKESVTGNAPLASIEITGALPTQKFSYASVNGFLILTAATDVIHLIKYDGTSFSYSPDRLLVRDLWGVPGYDYNDFTSRPGTLTDDHLYNLRNQGWGIPRKEEHAGTSTVVRTILGETVTTVSDALTDPIEIFNVRGSYPSNADVVYTAMKFKTAKPDVPPSEVVFGALWDEQIGLNAQAAKGYFIIDALRRGTSRFTACNDNDATYPELKYHVGSLKSDITTGGASFVADFAGRVFYTGFFGSLVDGHATSPNLSEYVLFSQVIQKEGDIVKCYQEGDPTSREGSDLVDTDGGFIRVSGAKNIVGIRAMDNELFILAENGVWLLTGGNDYGFSATNYKLTKVSSFGCHAPESVVETGKSILFCGDEGIFRIGKSELGDWATQSLSDVTIQKIYNDIDTLARRSIRAVHDPLAKKVKFLYKEEGFSKEIVFDTFLNSFNKVKYFNLEADSPEIVAYLTTLPYSESVDSDEVVVNTDSVISSAESVIVNRVVKTSRTYSTKYIVLYGTVGGKVGYTVAYQRDANFRDWFSVDSTGVDAKAFILTGAVTAGDASIYKQVPYLVVHFQRTEKGVEEINGELVPASQSGCKIRSQWDWSNSANSGVWSPLFQAYKYHKPYLISDIDDPYDTGFTTVVTKNKLRGRGRALSIYFETEPYKNCILIGWDLAITGNSLT